MKTFKTRSYTRLNHPEVVRLYQSGVTSLQIARRFGYKLNSVCHYLAKHGLLRENVGKEWEDRVEEFFRSQGRKVVRQSATHPFDLLVDGIRYDVKSAKRSKNGWIFGLWHGTKSKDTEKSADRLALVPRGMERKPLYEVDTKGMGSMRHLGIVDPSCNKWKPRLLGYLDEVK